MNRSALTKCQNVLITGVGGFIGRHLSRIFSEHGYSVTGVDRAQNNASDELLRMDLPNPAFSELLCKLRPSLLIHAAGSADVANSLKNPEEDFRGNVILTEFVLESLRQNAPGCRMVLLSSAAVYGTPERLPIAEDAPCRPISPYGFHKKMCELLAQEYEDLHSIPTVCLRIFSAYGEGLKRQVVYDLYRKMTDPDCSEIEVYGTGEETRDFLHVEDVAAAVRHLYETKASGVFNVASGGATRIGDLAAMLAEQLHCRKPIRFNGRIRPGDPPHWRADTSKLAATGFCPTIELPQGLQRVISQFCEAPEKVY